MNRCAYEKCNKKLNLVPYTCRCEKMFCSKHRLPETHNCNYDYKNKGKEILKKNNPLIINKKIITI